MWHFGGERLPISNGTYSLNTLKILFLDCCLFLFSSISFALSFSYPALPLLLSASSLFTIQSIYLPLSFVLSLFVLRELSGVLECVSSFLVLDAGWTWMVDQCSQDLETLQNYKSVFLCSSTFKPLHTKFPTNPHIAFYFQSTASLFANEIVHLMLLI